MNPSSSLQNRRGFLKTFVGGAALLGVSGLTLRGVNTVAAAPVALVPSAAPAEVDALAASAREDELGYDQVGDPGWSY